MPLGLDTLLAKGWFLASGCLTLFTVGVLLQPAAHAQPQTCVRPTFEMLRYEEDYAFLADPSCRTETLDGAKYIELGSRRYLTIGGDLRERYEYVRNPDWGRDPSDPDGYLLHRLMVHSDLHLGTHFRTFVQLKSAIVGDRTGGARPSDQDTLDLHQAFTDLILGREETGALTIRGGRQEIVYGSSRLLSVREGPNVRRSFDGLRVMYQMKGFQVDALAFSAVETDPGIFDDGREDNNWLWGAYAVGPLVDDGLGIDLYYLAIRRPHGEYSQGAARELRHSVGTRAWGQVVQLDYNFEFVVQLGRFGDDRIRAWTVASDTGYTVPVQTKPRLGLRADITSGDLDLTKGNLQTFYALYPKGNYFGEASLVGPMNHRDLHPTFELHPTEALQLMVDWLFFWRHSRFDGLYRVSGAPQVDPGMSRERYVGSQVTLSFEWEIERHLSLEGAYSHFFPGAFLEQSGLAKHVDFVAVWAACRL